MGASVSSNTHRKQKCKTLKQRKEKKGAHVEIGGTIPWKGWSQEKPGVHERTVMLEKCGSKCFLGPNKSFPICKKNTCDISKKGVYSAYIRARQYKYPTISKKARRILDQKI